MANTSQRNIFSMQRLSANKSRARLLALDDADFIVRHAAATIAERLDATQRVFPVCADLFSPFGSGLALIKASHNTGVGFAAVLPPHTATENSGQTVMADLEMLPFAPRSLSLALSLFAIHRSNDLPGLLAQIRMALKPDGLFLGCLPGSQTLGELRQAIMAAESDISGAAALRIDPFGEVRQYGDLLQRAGFALPVVDTETLTVRYSDLKALVNDLRAMGAAGAFSPPHAFASRRLFERASTIYRERFSDPDGRIRATVEIVYLSGWAPDASQQKPLKPGTARNSLKDFL